jgi:hypothetical protein
MLEKYLNNPFQLCVEIHFLDMPVFFSSSQRRVNLGHHPYPKKKTTLIPPPVYILVAANILDIIDRLRVNFRLLSAS